MSKAPRYTGAVLAWMALWASAEAASPHSSTPATALPPYQTPADLLQQGGGNGAIVDLGHFGEADSTSDSASGFADTLPGTDMILPPGMMADPVAPIGPGLTTPPPLWSIGQGVRFFQRSRTRHKRISLDLPSIGSIQPNLVLSSRSVGFNPSAGCHSTIARHLGRDQQNRDHFLEFGYWGAVNWQDQRIVSGERLAITDPGLGTIVFGSLFSQFDQTTFLFDSTVGGFNRADEHQIAYDSQVNDFEVNYWVRPRGRPDRLVLQPNGKWRREPNVGQYFSGMFGVRYMLWNDQFSFLSRGLINDNGVLHNVRGVYDVDTENDLLGLQIGAEVIRRHPRWSWGLRAKAAGLYNFATQISTITTDAANDPIASTHLALRLADRQEQIAFIGQFGVVGTYKLLPHLTARGAYDLMWINGLALGPEQLTFEIDPVPHVNTNGGAFLQGLTLDLVATW